MDRYQNGLQPTGGSTLSAAITGPTMGDARTSYSPASSSSSSAAGPLRRGAGALEREVREPVLLERLRASDPDALDALLRIYWRPLVRYAARLLPYEEDAEDVAQEAFVRLWERRNLLAPDTVLRPFLYRIVHNIALNRKRSWRARNSWYSKLGSSWRSLLATPLQSTMEHELERAIEDAIQALPARRRDAFVLARFHDMSYSKIALIMGISSQTVANQISSALSDLRRALSPYMESAADE
jgi:RNA polymerase sigma-70 factor (ECF subfamily)